MCNHVLPKPCASAGWSVACGDFSGHLQVALLALGQMVPTSHGSVSDARLDTGSVGRLTAGVSEAGQSKVVD